MKPSSDASLFSSGGSPISYGLLDARSRMTFSCCTITARSARHDLLHDFNQQLLLQREGDVASFFKGNHVKRFKVQCFHVTPFFRKRGNIRSFLSSLCHFTTFRCVPSIPQTANFSKAAQRRPSLLLEEFFCRAAAGFIRDIYGDDTLAQWGEVSFAKFE